MRYIRVTVMLLLTSLALSGAAEAQISASPTLSTSPNGRTTLEEMLVRRLRVTSNEQKAYLKFLLKQVRAGKLDVKLVLAIQHKALGKNPIIPFPYFERAMQVPEERFLINIDRYANTSAASVPLVLEEYLANGTIQPTDTVLMVAFGAGLTWGSALVRY